jgi:radical SAM superfamily enzyme YgiQ (UPF0313 family)
MCCTRQAANQGTVTRQERDHDPQVRQALTMKWTTIERARGMLARERGAVIKEWGGRLPIALVYPNTYRVGMSSLGFHAVYRLFNAHSNVVCERAFWQPRFDADDPVALIETQRPIADSAVIAFSTSFEMDYPHLVQVLRQARVPLRAAERDTSWPLVIAGGAAVSANPLPLADLLDAVVIGEAETVIDPLVEVLWDLRSGPRETVWQALARIPGVYVPAMESQPVHRQWVRDLDAFPTSTVIHTPDTEFGGISLIEVARGCSRGCRFCLAGFTSLPKREHSLESVLEQAKEGLRWEARIGLVGAAVSDYTQIDALAARLREMGARLTVSSLRASPLSEPLLQALADSNAQTLTLAPEAGSQRLRQIVNKGITEADLFHAAERAAHYGFRQVKLYFMLGLPTETEQDVLAIAELCEATATRFPGQVTANITPFVPKAHTPFQWTEMTSERVTQGRLRLLAKRLKRSRIAVRSESPQWAAIQGILARGDRRLTEVLVSLEGTSPSSWRRALAAHDIQPDDYLQARAPQAPLPWDFIHTGVCQAYLQREWSRALAGQDTDVCAPVGCAPCGE